MEELKLFRTGAFWIAEDGSRLIWDDSFEVFQREDTGEIYDVIERLSDDCVIVG